MTNLPETPSPSLGALFLTFFKIGALTFGGGYAMVPIIEHELIEKKKWLDEKEVLDIMALCQSLPGVIAANSANLIGYRLRGRRGALWAVLGAVIPSFLIILTIAAFLTGFRHEPLVIKAFTGIRCVVVALMLRAALKFWKKSVIDGLTGFLAVLSFIGVTAGISPFVNIVSALILGFVLYRFFPRYTDGVFRRKP